MSQLLALNWHPAYANSLDYIQDRCECSLATPNGTSVRIYQNFPGYTIFIGSERIETPDNLTACYVLNMHEVGVVKGLAVNLLGVK